jgi:hypothetical protein
MKNPITHLLLCTLLCIAAPSFGQDAEEPSLDSGTLQSQFDYMMEESNRYKSFKVVKQAWLNTFLEHVQDSLRAERQEIAQLELRIDNQEVQIRDLQNDLATTQDQLNSVTLEKDSMALLGIPISKAMYRLILWGLVLVLAALLATYIIRFKRSNVITKASKAELAETVENFENFQKAAREKEQKLKRELQDEINKHL